MIQPDLLLQCRYRVLKQLGQGGFSRTFEVDDRGTLKVLKVLSLERFHDSKMKQKTISLFQREASVLSRLRHPGIPAVELDGYFTLTADNFEDMHCLVMEKIDGLNLKQWLEKRGQPIDPEQAINWLTQMAEVLTQLHQQELIHRDIKPCNIMLKPNGQLVLIDFGAVREVTATYLSKQKMDISGTRIGSAGYMPLEQAEGQAVPQSDFFALGRTFVYLLTGKQPIEFDKNPRTGKLNWRDSAPQVSPQLAVLIDYLMDLFPGKRPQTPQMILRCIEEIVSPIPALSVTSVQEQRLPGRVNLPESFFVSRKQTVLSLISHFIPTLAPSSPWQKAELRHSLSGHTDVVSSLAIAPDGETLASGSYDGTIKLWSLRSGKLLRSLEKHTNRVTCVAISPDGETLASGSYDRTIKLWALHTGELLLNLTGHSDRVRSIAFSPNGQMLVSSGMEIHLWAVLTGKLLNTLSRPSESARFAAFSPPDGQTCVIGSLDGTIELWNPHNGKRLRKFSSQSGVLTSIAFSSDGQTLASGSARTIELWNLHTGKQLQPFSSQVSGPRSVAFSPDGQTLASGSGKTIELWSMPSGKKLCSLSGHSHLVRPVAFSPKGFLLVSGSCDRTIKVWQPA